MITLAQYLSYNIGSEIQDFICCYRIFIFFRHAIFFYTVDPEIVPPNIIILHEKTCGFVFFYSMMFNQVSLNKLIQEIVDKLIT